MLTAMRKLLARKPAPVQNMEDGGPLDLPADILCFEFVTPDFVAAAAAAADADCMRYGDPGDHQHSDSRATAVLHIKGGHGRGFEGRRLNPLQQDHVCMYVPSCSV